MGLLYVSNCKEAYLQQFNWNIFYNKGTFTNDIMQKSVVKPYHKFIEKDNKVDDNDKDNYDDNYDDDDTTWWYLMMIIVDHDIW